MPWRGWRFYAVSFVVLSLAAAALATLLQYAIFGPPAQSAERYFADQTTGALLTAWCNGMRHGQSFEHAHPRFHGCVAREGSIVMLAAWDREQRSFARWESANACHGTAINLQRMRTLAAAEGDHVGVALLDEIFTRSWNYHVVPPDGDESWPLLSCRFGPLVGSAPVVGVPIRVQKPQDAA